MRHLPTATTRLLLCIILGVLTTVPAHAQGAADDAAVRARLAAYAAARMQRDAKAEALCYTADGDFRSSQGPFVAGRSAVESQLTVTNPAYRFSLSVSKLRFVADGVAVVDADLLTGLEGREAPLIGTYVLTKQGSDWLIAAARIALPPPARK